jgi:hypothetical protein
LRELALAEAARLKSVNLGMNLGWVSKRIELGR